MRDNKSSSLADFAFDDEDSFNFDTPGGIPIATKKKEEVKVLDEDDEEDDDGAPPTKLEKTKPKPEEEEEILDAGFDFGPAAPAPKQKRKEEVKEEVEDEIDEPPVEKKEEPKKPEVVKKEEVKGTPPEESSFEEMPEKFYTNLALDMKERGTLTIDVDIDEEKDLTEEEFFNLQEAEIESRFNETLEAFKEEFDEDGKEYLRWKKSGGTTKDFVTKYLAPSFTLATFDETSQSNIDRTIDHYLKTVEQLEDDELEDRKQYIKDSGREKDYAKKFFDKLQKADVGRKEALQKQLEDAAKKEVEDDEAFNEELVETLNTMTSIGSFNVNDKEKKVLANYMTKPAVKVGKNRYIPKFQFDLRNILVASNKDNKRRLIALGKILANDFKLLDLEQKVETTVTKRAKARIASNTPKGSTGSAGRGRQLADMIDE